MELLSEPDKSSSRGDAVIFLTLLFVYRLQCHIRSGGRPSGATGGGVTAATWVFKPDMLDWYREPGLARVKILRREDPGQWMQAKQYISPGGESIHDLLVFLRKAITSDFFFVSRECGFFRFKQRPITKPIAPICRVVVSAGKPINWMHASN